MISIKNVIDFIYAKQFLLYYFEYGWNMYNV